MRSILDEFSHFFIIPLIIGILGGFSAYIFRYLIKLFSHIYTIGFLNNSLSIVFLMPLFFLFSNFLVSRFINENPEITLDNIAKKISIAVGKFSIVKSFLALFLTSLGIGVGVPVGREAPIAKLGGLLAEIFIKVFKISRINMPIYLSAGVSSAVSATFNAPIAGIFLGLEIILGRINNYIVIPLIISSTVATLISQEFIGKFTAFYVPKLDYTFDYLYFLPLSAIFFSCIAIIINFSLKQFKIFRFLYIERWRYIVFFNGFIVGLIIYLVPEVKGVGYEYINDLFENKYFYEHTFIIALGKMIGTVVSLGSGLFGGIVSPSIFIGSFTGYWFGGLFENYNIDPRVFALIGSASILAGLSKAPVRSSIIIVELTHSYQLFIPTLLTAGITSYFLSKFEPASYFRRTLIQKGLDVDNRLLEEFRNITDLNNFVENIPTLKPEYSLKKAIKVFAKSEINYLPVIDKNNEV